MLRIQVLSLNTNDNVRLVTWGGSDSEPTTTEVVVAANTHTMVSDIHRKLLRNR